MWSLPLTARAMSGFNYFRSVHVPYTAATSSEEVEAHSILCPMGFRQAS
jgi:hypothetical protein